MSTFHHPFVAKLVKTFQDVCNFYMVIDAVDVYTLADLIACSPKKFLPQPSVRFTAACLVEALNHLHQYRVGHRDIKPSNIVINEHGYCILTGFDTGNLGLSCFRYLLFLDLIESLFLFTKNAYLQF